MNGPNNPISWCDWTWNPVKGLCPVNCSYCYARRIYKRFHYDPTIRFDAKEFSAVEKLKKPARIFVGSTIELFGDWIPDEWIYTILEQARKFPQHIFQFLTKFPDRMYKFNFPPNCWCGSTITTNKEITRIYQLERADASIKFISFEPLHSFLEFDDDDFESVDWVIIGAETGNRKGKILPQPSWIQSILLETWWLRIPVFMKDNLKPYWYELRQEFPE
jgi:protein gp37